MKATFDFIPKFCPNCGAKLFTPENAQQLESLRYTLDDYHAGEPFTCKCGLNFRKEQPQASAPHD